MRSIRATWWVRSESSAWLMQIASIQSLPVLADMSCMWDVLSVRSSWQRFRVTCLGCPLTWIVSPFRLCAPDIGTGDEVRPGMIKVSSEQPERDTLPFIDGRFKL
jgi:hypothetical protein